MKSYHGRRTEHGCAVDVEDNGEVYCLNPRHDLKCHSPYRLRVGITPAAAPPQLALALAADVLGDDDQALQLYQRLKFRLVGGLPHDGWVLTEGRIRSAIDDVRHEQGRRRQ